MEQNFWKGNAQLIARCTYIPASGKSKFESFAKYYPKQQQERG